MPEKLKSALAKKIGKAIERHKAAQHRYPTLQAAEKAPTMEPNNVLKKAAYELGNYVLENGKEAQLQKYVKKRLRSLGMNKSGLSCKDSNIFTWAFRALLLASIDSAEDTPILSSQTRSKYAAMLGYAARHKVPSELLIGFLHQCGPYERLKPRFDDPTVMQKWWRPEKWDFGVDRD